MRTTFSTLGMFWAIAFVASTLLDSSFAQDVTSADNMFISAELGILDSPPRDLLNITSTQRSEDFLKMKLLCRSGLDDSVPDWRSLSIETYPRAKLDNLSDLAAILVMAKMVVGPGAKQLGRPNTATVGVFHFVTSEFQFRDVRVLKYGRVYTTILNGEMVSFAFVATSWQVLDTLATSLTTIRQISRSQRKYSSLTEGLPITQ